jgi:hypothetical protein
VDFRVEEIGEVTSYYNWTIVKTMDGWMDGWMDEHMDGHPRGQL